MEEENENISNVIGLTPPGLSETPKLPRDFIERSQYTAALHDLFQADHSIVLVDGEQGSGTTLLLAHFCHTYGRSCFPIFIRSASRITYSIDYLRMVLAEQLWWYAYGKPSELDSVDQGAFTKLVINAKKKARGQNLYIVVDGLHQVPADEFRHVEQILNELLPFIEPFKFIITGSPEFFRKTPLASMPKVLTVSRFSEYEANAYLADLNLDPLAAEQAKKLCRYLPANMASLKRLILSGSSLDQVLDADPSKHLDFIRLEFEKVDSLGKECKDLLALITFSKHSMTREELLNVCSSASAEDLEILLSNCSFLEAGDQADEIKFASDAHQRTAEALMTELRKSALEMQVSYLASNPSSPVAVQFLPTYYRLLGKQQQLVDCLSADHYGSLLATTHSITALRTRAALGSRTAQDLKQAVDILRFSLQRSIFGSLGANEELQSEVGALAALGLNDMALNVATKAASNESRLSLLAEYCRRVREREGTIDPQIKDYIESIAPSIDFSELGESAISIAENLLFVLPDLALKIVDEAVKGSHARDQKKNLALAQLSMAATLSSIQDGDIDQKASSEISDESLQKVLSTLRSFVKDSSFDEIISIAGGMEIDRRIYFLRRIIGIAKESKRIGDVVTYAIDQLVANAAYMPKAADLADFAIALPYVTDQSTKTLLAKRIEGQIPLLERSAPSKDLVLLQVRLAHAEIGSDNVKASARLNEAYFELDNIGSLETRVDCLAIMLSSLSDIDPDGVLEKSDGFSHVFREDLLKSVDELIDTGANHFQILKKSIRSIALASPNDAKLLAGKLNSVYGRDDAYLEIIRVISAAEYDATSEQMIRDNLSRISDPSERDRATVASARAASTSNDKSSWLPLLASLASECQDAASSASVCLVGVSMADVDTDKSIVEEFLSLFESGIAKIDSVYAQVEFRYEMVSVLARIDFSNAERLYKEATTYQASSPLSNRSVANVITQCLALVARSFRPLMSHGELSEETLVRFFALCDSLPCALTRINIYADIACKFWCENRIDDCKRIVQEKIRPLLDDSMESSRWEHNLKIAAAFPALFCANTASAIRELEQLTYYQRESALYRAAKMVLRRLSPGEPDADLDDEKLSIDFGALTDILTLLAEIEGDSTFWQIVRASCSALHGKDNKKVTRTQKSDFVARLQDLISDKLPDQKNILHDGYSIVCMAQVYRLQDARNSEWNELIERGKTVPNLADRAYVLLEVSACLPPRMLEVRKRVLADAKELIYAIPSSYDRYTRIESYIKFVRDVQPPLAKPALRDALVITLDQGQRDMATRWRRNLVDLAESISANLSDLISDISDDDPARLEAKKEIKRNIEIQALRKKMYEGSIEHNQPQVVDGISSAASRNLNSLISGRLSPKPPENLVPYVSLAGSMYLREAYPVFAWFVENAVRKCLTASDVTTRVTPISEVALLTTELAFSVIGNLSQRTRPAMPTPTGETVGASLVVRPGDRVDALQFIRSWLRANIAERIVLCDPYFSKHDHEFLKIVLNEAPNARVTIVTSQKASQDKASASSEDYLSEWRLVSDEEPPLTEVIAVGGNESRGEILIHDRWILSGVHALRMGTSFGTLGVGKLSELSPLDADEAASVVCELDKFMRRDRVVNGARVSYLSFTI